MHSKTDAPLACSWNCRHWATGIGGHQAARSRPLDRRWRTPDVRACFDVMYDEMVAPGRSKSLTTGNIRCGVAAVHEVLGSPALETPVNVSHCAANRRVFNADLKLSMLSTGSRSKSGNEYPDDRTRDGESSTTKTCCDGVVAWSADDSWLTALTRAIRRAKLQSNRHHQQTDTQFFLQAGCLSCGPTNSVKTLHNLRR